MLAEPVACRFFRLIGVPIAGWLLVCGLARAEGGVQAAAAAPVSASAQQPGGAQPVYDVASIKPHKSDDNSSSWGSHDGSYSAANVSLKLLLSAAYGIREGLISGLPKWAEDARFDVQAKMVDPDPVVVKNLTKEQREGMLAALLADRFHARAHRATKELPVYEMTVAKDGPKFKVNSQQGPGSGPNKGLVPGSWRTSMNGPSHMELDADAMPMASLAELLSAQLNRTVIDKTNLTGKYDLVLKWTPQDAAMTAPDSGSPADPGPSIFSAMTEQLGLRLEPAKGPVVTLVVDHVETPSEN